MEILGKILGNPARVKLMKLFLLNRDKSFSVKDAAKRVRVTPQTTNREFRTLASVDFIKKDRSGWTFNHNFKYTNQFMDLLISSDNLDKNKILSSLKNSGQVKLILLSGIFIKNRDSRVDLLIVGDRIKKGKVEEGIRKLEAEIGTELAYALFDTKEFTYRVSMYDKLVRDILDFPHEVLLQKKGLNLFPELSTIALAKPSKLI